MRAKYLVILCAALIINGCKVEDLKKLQSATKNKDNPKQVLNVKSSPQIHEPSEENCKVAGDRFNDYSRAQVLGEQYRDYNNSLSRELLVKCNIVHLQNRIKESQEKITLKKPPLKVNAENCAKGTGKTVEKFLRTTFENNYENGYKEYNLWFNDVQFGLSNIFNLKQNLSQNAKDNMSRYCEVFRGNKYLEANQKYLEKADFSNAIYMIWDDDRY